MSDAMNVLATEATCEKWREVFREEDGWIKRREVFTRFSRDVAARNMSVLVGPYAVWVNETNLRLDNATLGDLLRIANDLAATEFCGGWAEVER